LAPTFSIYSLFRKCTPILTIFSLLEQEVYAHKSCIFTEVISKLKLGYHFFGPLRIKSEVGDEMALL